MPAIFFTVHDFVDVELSLAARTQYSGAVFDPDRSIDFLRASFLTDSSGRDIIPRSIKKEFLSEIVRKSERLGQRRVDGSRRLIASLRALVAATRGLVFVQDVACLVFQVLELFAGLFLEITGFFLN